MSGAEVIFLIGVIANIIELVNFSTKIIDRIEGFSKDSKDIPEYFRDLQIELPLLSNTLKRTSIRANSGELDDDTCKAIKPLVLACEQKIKTLHAIFENVVPKNGASKIEIVWKSIRSLSKDKEVMQNAASIANLVRTLTLHYAEAAGLSPIERSVITEAVTKLSVSSNYEEECLDYYTPFDLTGAPMTGAFIGRKSDLNLMKTYLAPDTGTLRRQFCVIHGLGGLGKTQLAIEFARMNKREYSSVFWLDGTTEESLVQSLVKIEGRIRKKNMDASSEQAMPFEELKAKSLKLLEWFSIPQNNKWLLIYDNIDKTSFEAQDHDEESLKAFNITKYFPRGDVGSIIITTRLQRLAVLGESLKLNKLGVDESLEVLEKHAKKRLVDPRSINVFQSSITQQDKMPSDVCKLIEKLDGLPLALVIAGRYIAKTTVAKYLQLYDKSWKELHASNTKLGDYPNRSILTTWMISYRSLSQANNLAANLLILWACLSHRDLWYELLCWPTDRSCMPKWLQMINESEITFLDTISSILDQSLIEQAENSNSYVMHSVVHDWMRFCKIGETADEYITAGIVCVGLRVPIPGDKDFWVPQQRLLPHADRLSEQIYQMGNLSSIDNEDYRLVVLIALKQLGDFYSTQYRMAHAEQMYDLALMGCRQVLEPKHGLTLAIINNLALLYCQQMRLEEAEKAYLQALEAYEESLGPNHMSTVNTIHNLGGLYSDQWRLSEAQEMYNRALSKKENALGPNHTSTLDTVLNLGNLFKLQGSLLQAEQMYKRALAGYQLNVGPHHPSTLLTVNNLGNLYFRLGKMVEAEQMYNRALAGQEKTMGLTHRETIDTLFNLAVLFSEQRKFEEAEKTYLRVLIGYENIYGPNHYTTINTLRNLGNLYRYQGRLVDAAEIYERKLAAYIVSRGLNHRYTIYTLYVLGNLYEGQGDAIQAKSYFERIPAPNIDKLWCNGCRADINYSSVTYYHCCICNDNDFDLCEKCVLDGAFCLDLGHQLMKRRFLNGEYVVSSFSRNDLAG